MDTKEEAASKICYLCNEPTGKGISLHNEPNNHAQPMRWAPENVCAHMECYIKECVRISIEKSVKEAAEKAEKELADKKDLIQVVLRQAIKEEVAEAAEKIREEFCADGTKGTIKLTGDSKIIFSR